MKTYSEASRNIPVFGEFDVLVVGGGPAGVSAALASARCGARTMLIESANCLGGIATTGMMSHWSGGTVSPIVNEYQKKCQDMHWPIEDSQPWHPFAINHEKLKLVLFNSLLDAGVTIRLHTFCADAIMEGNRLTGVVMESKSGREAVFAKVIVDATGDGDVAARAGAVYQKGREADGRMQPVTLMFKIAGVDYDRAIFPGSFETLVDVPKGEIQALGRVHLPPPAGHTLLYKGTIRGQVVVNMCNLTDIDGTNADDLTLAEIESHRQIPKIIDFLREYAPGYEDCYLLASASVVGVRETRHFQGEYTLTAEDIVEARLFEDWIAVKNHFNFDIHNLDGAGLDKDGAQKKFKSKGAYSIPYRSCVPIGIDNLLLAGRDISGTHKAHSNYRVMPICANMGHGVGVAAAQSALCGIVPRKVDILSVQAELNKQGVSAE